MSPHCIWADAKVGVIAIAIDGGTYGNFVPNAGGVQFMGLCYYSFGAEALLRRKIILE